MSYRKKLHITTLTNDLKPFCIKCKIVIPTVPDSITKVMTFRINRKHYVAYLCESCTKQTDIPKHEQWFENEILAIQKYGCKVYDLEPFKMVVVA